MLTRLRRHGSVAAVLIASLVLLGAPHSADPLHDPDLAIGAGVTLDVSGSVLALGPDTDASETHCLACHASRSFRPRTQPRPVAAPAPEATSLFPVEIFTASPASSVAQPPLRAPPASPSLV